MLLTQLWGTILGGFINYAVMISIVAGNRDALVNTNGDSSWSGATMQAYNTSATSWALSTYLYKAGQEYGMVPVGIAIGAAAVVVHRIFYQVGIILVFRNVPESNVSFSLFLRSAVSMSPISTCLSSFSTLVIFHTTKVRPAFCSAGLSPDSMCNTTSAITNLASSRTIRTS